MKDTKETCKSCKFFFSFGGKGECKRNPPTVFRIGASSITYRYPEVYWEQWCGEYVRKALLEGRSE